LAITVAAGMEAALTEFPMVSIRSASVLILALAMCVGARGVMAADAPSFAKVIGPLLATRCSKCHGATRQKNDLRLDSADAVKAGGKNGPVVVAGKPEDSPIFIRTTKPPGDKDRMPAQGELLTKEQTEAIRAWIMSGAKFD
jgi:mono/diheme cytochrome c family protein